MVEYRRNNVRLNSQGSNGNNYNLVRDFSELSISLNADNVRLVQKHGCHSWYALGKNGENGPFVNVKKDDIGILFGDDKEAIRRCLEKYF
jgi:hypothetical protein